MKALRFALNVLACAFCLFMAWVLVVLVLSL